LSGGGRLVAVGRVGAPHGRDGSFWVEGALGDEGASEVDAAGAGDRTDTATGAAYPRAPIAEGAEVTVAGRHARVERRAGTNERPLLRLSGVGDRGAAAELRGERLLVPEAHAPLAPGEWLVDDLVGARVEGVGEVRRVLAGISCDLLEVGEEATLVPLVTDAVRRIDSAARTIDVDRRFLGLDELGGEQSPE